MDIVNDTRRKVMQKYFESLGEYIYKFAKDKNKACIYILNPEDELFVQKISEFQTNIVNFDLSYSYLTTKDIDNLENIKKQYDFILLTTISYKNEKRNVKLEVINKNIIKVTYFVQGERMSWDDYHIMENSFGETLYNTYYSEEDGWIYSLKSQYEYLEPPKRRKFKITEFFERTTKKL